MGDGSDDVAAAWRTEALARMDEIERGEVTALDGDTELASIERELHAPRG